MPSRGVGGPAPTSARLTRADRETLRDLASPFLAMTMSINGMIETHD